MVARTELVSPPSGKPTCPSEYGCRFYGKQKWEEISLIDRAVIFKEMIEVAQDDLREGEEPFFAATVVLTDLLKNGPRWNGNRYSGLIPYSKEEELFGGISGGRRGEGEELLAWSRKQWEKLQQKVNFIALAQDPQERETRARELLLNTRLDLPNRWGHYLGE